MKRQTETAFTLLEVLAAVSILGIWFGVLASVAIQGMRAEGESERRIRASLVADRYVTGLEVGIDIGQYPEEAEGESEEDEFTILVESLPITEMEPSAAADSGGENGDFLSLLDGELAGLAPDLYSTRVSVSWKEGAAEKTVHRTIYYWDNTTLVEILDKEAAQKRREEDGLDPASESSEDDA
ncbi:MAG: hypothetical protein VX466_00260 [Myxococcota bacterium]|nr:hypothetical protein [Myxococcota bacterium]